MQRMLNSRDLIKGEVYGTYKLFTSLPDASSINFENDKIKEVIKNISKKHNISETVIKNILSYELDVFRKYKK
jgi:hypothetical protein